MKKMAFISSLGFVWVFWFFLGWGVEGYMLLTAYEQGFLMYVSNLLKFMPRSLFLSRFPFYSEDVED